MLKYWQMNIIFCVLEKESQQYHQSLTVSKRLVITKIVCFTHCFESVIDKFIMSNAQLSTNYFAKIATNLQCCNLSHYLVHMSAVQSVNKMLVCFNLESQQNIIGKQKEDCSDILNMLDFVRLQQLHTQVTQLFIVYIAPPKLMIKANNKVLSHVNFIDMDNFQLVFNYAKQSITPNICVNAVKPETSEAVGHEAGAGQRHRGLDS